MSDETAVPPKPGVATDFVLNTVFAPPNLFDLAKDEEKEKKEKATKTAPVTYDCHSQTFVLWRPPEECDYCKKLPEPSLEGPHNFAICPHVQNQEYQDIVNSVITMKTILHFEDFFMLPNGTRCVQLVWLTVKKVKKPKEKPVYPPNPEKVFAQKDEEPKDKSV